MDASMIGTIGTTSSTLVQSHAKATPGNSERVSFRDSLQAAQAIEKPVQQKPEAPVSAAKVGTSPLAKMRTPDASSADDVAATHAEKVENKSSQDTGAVVVAKQDTANKSTEAEVADAVVVQTAEQSLPVPLPGPILQAVVSTKIADAKDSKNTANTAAKAIARETSKSDIAVPTTAANIEDTQGTQPAVVAPVADQLPAALVPVVQRLDVPATAGVKGAGVKTSNNLAVNGSAKRTDGESKKSDVAAADAGLVTKVDSLPVSPAASAAVTHDSVTSGVTAAPVSHAGISPVSKATAAVVESAMSAKTVHAATSQGEVATLVATPNVLEIGIAAGSHGWLRVRAELGQMGQVTASVAAASSGAAEGLHKELPAIAAYLASERVDVSALSVGATAKTAGAQDAAMSFGSGTNQRNGNPGSSPEKTPMTTEIDFPGTGPGTGFGSGWQGFEVPAAMLGNGSGSWLSVRV